jgi:predicted ATP-binding protein involved in virulence
MRIDRLALHYFRHIERHEFVLAPQFNLVIGTPGSGKTSVLDALAIALGAWSLGLPGSHDPASIGPDDLRAHARTTRKRVHPATRIEAHGEIPSQGSVSWVRSRTSPQSPTDNSQAAAFVQRVRILLAHLGGPDLPESSTAEAVDMTQAGLLPLIAFYGQGRQLGSHSGRTRRHAPGNAHTDLRERRLTLRMRRALALADRPSSSSAELRRRLSTYADAFDIRPQISDIEDWLLDLSELDARTALDTLQTILSTGRQGDAAQLGLSPKNREVYAHRADGLVVALEQLSSSERQLLTLGGDLIRRILRLNGHLGAQQALLQTAGVVLIDELEAQLHPQIQRHLVETLRTLFPALQFVATTNSPFLVQSLRGGHELLMMRGQPTAELSHQSLETIASGLMEVGDDAHTSGRYQAMQRTARDYLQTLQLAKTAPLDQRANYQQQLDQKLQPFADNPAFQAFLDMQRAARLGE